MSQITFPRASSAPARRRALASLALAVGLALSACGGGDDDAPAEREAYQPGSASSSASASSEPTDDAGSAQPSSEPADEASSSPASDEEAESSAPEEQPSPEPEEQPSAAPAQEDCVGSDYLFTDLRGDIGCYDAKVAVEKVLNNGTPMGAGVSDGNVMCDPSGAEWTCAQLGDTVYGITIQAKDLAKDPLRDILDSSSSDDSDDAEQASITCSGAAYDFSDVRGMECSEALAILDPFADRRVPEGRSGGTQCSMEKVSGQEHWSCSRDSGGSFTAVSR